MSLVSRFGKKASIGRVRALYGADITQEDNERIKRYERNWNFYKGYHYEEIDESNSPEVTENYCGAFVNKYVAFEFGKGFTIRHPKHSGRLQVAENTTLAEFLDEVWDNNKKDAICFELGQSKSVTGDAWLQPRYYGPDEIDDPYGIHPEGQIKISVIPSTVVFPEYDPHNADKLVRLRVIYSVEDEKSYFKGLADGDLYIQEYTKDYIRVTSNGETTEVPNEYGFIPFVQIKNFPIAGESFGMSDLEDLIPLNVELNLKKSDISEILEYHAAPVTLVFGANVNNLQRGANKIWGGLPKDANIRNLELQSDLGASAKYIDSIKNAMHEVGGVPEGALGGGQHISNTSGVALQIVNKPLIERTNVKRLSSKAGLEELNRMIIFLAEFHDLISLDNLGEWTRADVFNTEVVIADTMPKDRLMELNQIAQEISLRIEDRKGAMERLGVQNIEEKLARIDAEVEKIGDVEEMKNKHGKTFELSDGTMNSERPLEQVRKEMFQQNVKDDTVDL